MDMEELVGSSSNEVSQIAKGKRSKRQRLSTPNGGNSNMMTCSSSSTASGGLVHGGDYGNSFSSTTSCSYESTEDEEDMANCLILLAQGNSAKQVKNGGRKTDKFSSRKLAHIATSNTAFKTGFVVYECKTCNRAFPSFQALGGHRASHKKPKVTAVENKSSPSSPPSIPAPSLQPSDNDHEVELEGGERHVKSNMTLPPAHHDDHHQQDPTPLSLSAIRGMNQNKAKIHECSICGSEFSSGQALGGHMRRHRAATSSSQIVGLNISHVNHTTTMNDMDIKSRNNILELDLNLPAPEEDNRDSSSKFQYTPTQRSLVLSAPALVDCHY